MTVEEENKAILQRVIKEAHSEGNLDVVDEIYAPDYVLHTSVYPTGEEIRGPEGIKQLISSQHDLVSNLEFTVEDQIVEGDKVVTRYTASCVVLSTRIIDSPGIIISRIADGKIVEEWNEYRILVQDLLAAGCQIQ